MSDEETIREMRYLYNDAEKYAWYAFDHLVLDTIIDKEPPLDPAILDKMSEFDQLIEKLKDVPRLLSKQSPKGYSVSLYLQKFIIHYIFPNLSDEERLLIEKASSEAESVFSFRRENHDEDEKLSLLHLREHVEAMKTFESKLTVVQMALLDSRFCDPDSKIDYEL